MMAVFTAGAVTGDVNGDAEVNIADVNAVIEIIMNNSHDMAADVNGDGEINIADVNTIIDIILSDEPVGEIIPKEIALDYSELAEPAETIPEDEEALDYGDYVENTTWSTTMYINFDGDTATVTGETTATSSRAARPTVRSSSTASASSSCCSMARTSPIPMAPPSTTSAASRCMWYSRKAPSTPCATVRFTT